MAPHFEEPTQGNLYIVILLTAVSLISVFIIKNKDEVTLELGTMSLTGKENFIAVKSDERSFIQKYPQDTQTNHFKKLNALKTQDLYPHAMKEINSETKTVSCDFLDGGELRSSENHYEVISNFLDQRQETSGIGFVSSTPDVEDIFEANLDQNLLQRICDEKYWGVIHGDLHPGNLVINKNHAIAIDWDLAGEGYIWFDYLTLLTHPWTNLSINERIELFRKKFVEFTETDVKILFDSFRDFKSKQLKGFIEYDPSLSSLVKEYSQPLS